MCDAGRGARGKRPLSQQPVRRPGIPESNSANSPLPKELLPGMGRGAIQGGKTPGTPGVDQEKRRDDIVEAGPSGGRPFSSPPPPNDDRQSQFGRGLSHFRSSADSLTQLLPPGTRNKIGTKGRIINVSTNYFEVVKKPNVDLFQYHVHFQPEIEFPGVRKDLVRIHKELLKKYIFHGNTLYTTTRLPQPLELKSARPRADEGEIKLNFIFVGVLTKMDDTYTSFMNIILRRCLQMLNLALMNRNYFDPKEAENIPGRDLALWPGYFTTIRYCESTFRLGVEIIHKLIHVDTAYTVIVKLRRRYEDDYERRIKAELVGKIVMTGYNNKTYRIDDIDFTKNPSSTFYLRKEDREITFAEYNHKRYGVKVSNLTQPMLLSRPSRRDINRGECEPISLIPEFCLMTGLTDEHRKDFNLMREMAGIKRINPDKRVASLLKFRRRLAETPEVQKELGSWGLQFSNKLDQCKARVLDPCMILTSNNQIPVDRLGEWGRSMHKPEMYVSVRMEDWIVIYPKKLDQTVRSFVNLIRQVGEPQRFPVSLPVFVPLESERELGFVSAMRDKLSQKHYNLVMCVLTTHRADIYNSIKRLTLCEMGIPSQVITERNISGNESKLKSVATKLMTQIACKLGAEPWRINSLNKPWMIIGYDTYHDARQKKAVGAFVASINRSSTRYHSSVKIHSANEDISPSFRNHTTDALKAYWRENRSFPEKIIVYRDGVGAGDIKSVEEIEIEGIKATINEVRCLENHHDYDPGIAFVVINKRINTRFFSETLENPPCGTVVDNTITVHNRFDFFLVSQKVNQGTVSPTHFRVIYNTANLTPDDHQSLAYALTHLYFNWPGTLRVPAPMQYAHKLAYLIGENTQKYPQENLAKLPYYL